MSKSKNWKIGKNTRIFSKIRKFELGNIIRKAHAKFQKATEGNYNDVNITKSENWKNGENSGKKISIRKTKKSSFSEFY